MEDQGVHDRINDLAREEHELWAKESRGETRDADRERLNHIGVMLDQCWDLLQQRRALRDAGRNPEDAQVRDEKTVEGYVR